MRDIKELARQVKMPYDFVTGEPINLEKLEAFAALVRADALAEQPAPVQQEPCAWTRPDSDHMPDTWEASCGAMWTFTEGGPKDNDMHFCPKCGKPAIEAAHGIKENT